MQEIGYQSLTPALDYTKDHLNSSVTKATKRFSFKKTLCTYNLTILNLTNLNS